MFYLRNSNSAGVADLSFQYGPAGKNWTAITGDWDNNGITTIGLYNSATGMFYLRNSNSAGVADLSFQYGPAGKNWTAITGDWDGNGTTTIGLYNQATGMFYLRNENNTGVADLTFQYGPSGKNWKVITGDWDNNGSTTTGALQSGYRHVLFAKRELVGSCRYIVPIRLGWKNLDAVSRATGTITTAVRSGFIIRLPPCTICETRTRPASLTSRSNTAPPEEPGRPLSAIGAPLPLHSRQLHWRQPARWLAPL